MSAGTSRLKRKLNEQGVNYTSGKATENFCLIGTPLPPLEKSKDSGEFVPLWKQDVRDEQGRRRLHGAFTGGFSAGYFNTVGSKEGWTPSTFVSSRSERGKKQAAKPEDFMDEEDLAELREKQLMAGVKEQRDILGGTQAELITTADQEQDSIADSIQRALMPPPDDSPGVRLLKKMGWRPGQGVGPRVTWRQRKVQDLLASGKSLNGINIDELDDDEEAKKHMYPPRDTAVVRISRKTDHHGLGYSSGLGLSESLGQKRTGQSGPKLAAGFGLGAVNEADDDDVDVYDSSSKHDRTYMPYDATHDAEVDTRQSRDSGKAKTQTSFVQQKFPDGTPLVAGFILSDAPVKADIWFPLPDIPPGWKPDPRRVWQKNADKENDTATPMKKDDLPSWRSKMTAMERGAILGETPLPTAPRSVFDYLSEADRKRIQNAAAGINTPPPLAAPPPAPSAEPTPSTSIPFTPPNIASAALKGFMPFPTDPVKQSRYIAYLRSQATPEYPELAPQPLPGQSTNDYNKELSDYAKSAAIFKPVSGAMATRFTTAAVVEHGPKIIEGLHQPTHESIAEDQEAREKAKAAEAARREEVVEGSKAHAAKLGMYGALTREVTPWQPSRLLCKRFGVKDPNPDITTDAPLPGAGAAWKPEQAMAEADLQTATTAAGSVPDPALLLGAGDGRRKHRDLENVGLGEDEDQGKDTLTYVRPSMDIFKAIFASDDEDSDDEEDVDKDGDVKMQDLPAPGPSAAPSKVSASAAPMPAHLRADKDAGPAASYEPSAPERPPAESEKVDIATFKPVFVPRGDRETKKGKDKAKDKKDKKKGKAIVSFMDEDEGAALHIAPQKSGKDTKDKEHRKKKRRKGEKEEKEEADVGDADMWVEKAPPPTVTEFAANQPAEKTSPEVPAPPPPPIEQAPSKPEGPPRARKRAIDFM
ncbi:hypothetical protein BV25DRAFT_1993879 [Artomyces pyxidatus]|uniref:Uncharacterized protein n=1 Tax=Artomyces pyxidatus TaxID=48021 RepID=A0ACB8SS79_9AGAM|nr:hypothetical protein BV25DRAFT_1993879 [Artomyces pyxidatus]